MAVERREQADLGRCLFGNPFKPAPPLDPTVLHWHGGAVLKLAEAVSQERTGDSLPILAAVAAVPPRNSRPGGRGGGTLAVQMRPGLPGLRRPNRATAAAPGGACRLTFPGLRGEQAPDQRRRRLAPPVGALGRRLPRLRPAAGQRPAAAGLGRLGVGLSSFCLVSPRAGIRPGRSPGTTCSPRGAYPDGGEQCRQALVTATLDGVAQLWDATAGDAPAPPLHHADGVRQGESFANDTAFMVCRARGSPSIRQVPRRQHGWSSIRHGSEMFPVQ